MIYFLYLLITTRLQFQINIIVVPQSTTQHTTTPPYPEVGGVYTNLTLRHHKTYDILNSVISYKIDKNI